MFITKWKIFSIKKQSEKFKFQFVILIRVLNIFYRYLSFLSVKLVLKNNICAFLRNLRAIKKYPRTIKTGCWLVCNSFMGFYITIENKIIPLVFYFSDKKKNFRNLIQEAWIRVIYLPLLKFKNPFGNGFSG